MESAGSDGGAAGATRESLAPIVNRADLTNLLAEVLPGVDIEGVAWTPVDPRGFRRALKSSLVFATFLTAPFIVMLKWCPVAWMALLFVWAWSHVRL